MSSDGRGIPTLSILGGVSMGSRLPSPGYKRGRGAIKFCCPKQGIVPLWNILPSLAVFYFLIWQVITSLYSAKSQLIALHLFTYCQAVALHNVSYKGQVSLCNVAFMGHYDMSLHIMMGFSNRLYVIAYCCSQQNGPIL